MKFLDKSTVEKALNFLGKESIFCTMRGILKKPSKDANGNGEIFYRFNLRTTNKEGYSQTFACIIPAAQAVDFKEKDFMDMKDKEVIIIPSLSNQINEWKSEETGKTGINNRLTLYISRMAVIGEGESNRTFDDDLTVNW
jgi:hypothetical protein